MLRKYVERVLSWLPRHSILGRVVHPMFEERKTLAGRMTWIGLFIIAAFVFIAIFAGVLAPYDPIQLSDEHDVPPWTNAPVSRNETFSAWSGNWTTAFRQYTVSWAQGVNGTGVTTKTAGEVLTVRGFSLSIRRDAVERVGAVLWILPNATADHYLTMEVSWDAAATWSLPIEVRTLGSLARIDLSNLTTWSAAKLATGTLQLRLTHASDAGAGGNVTLDYAGVTVVWRSYWHLMGTDPVGRDVFSRVLYGTRTSLVIMAIGVTVALAIGFPLGLYSGYRGGWFDKGLVLFMDSLYSFPGLLFAGLIAVLLGTGVFNIGLAVTVIYIPLYFRVTRSQVLSAREELYVEAARAIGAPPMRIVFRYIMMNVIVAIPVIFSISAADAILTAAGLSYLGLGVEAPTPDWGLDLSGAANLIDNGIWWSSFFPGLVIVILTIGLSFLGEGLNDIVNPLLQKERT
jgi:peptide/nickel transport system permease protein